MFSKSLKRCIALVLLVLVVCDPRGVWATWSTSVQNPPGTPPLSELILNANSGTTSTVTLVLTNPQASFAAGLASDRSILPGTCVSQSTTNQYGWNYWAKKMLPPGAVNPPNGDQVTLNLITLAGFSPTSTETVTCGIGTISSVTGKSYAIGQISAADQYVQFTIISTTSNILMRIVDPATNSPFPTSSAANVGALTEGGVREKGIVFDILMVGDVLNTSLVPMIMNATQCSSADTAACDFYKGAIMYNYFVDTVNDPQRIQIRAPRTLTRFFNTARNLIISLTIPSGRPYGLKIFPTNLYQGPDVTFTVAAYTGQMSTMCVVPFLANSNTPMVPRRSTTTIVVTENCIRGRNTTRQCPYAFWVTVNGSLQVSTSPAVLMQFVRTDLCFPDANQTAFSSPTNGYLFPFVTNVMTTQSLTGLNSPWPAVANYDLYFNVTGLPSYQIDVTETIQLSVPFSCLSSAEPPVNYINLVVVPSPGDLVGFVRNITINDIWNGGVVFEFHLGGESWKDIAETNTTNFVVGGLFDKASQQFVTAPGQQGWQTWKNCVLPDGSASFFVGANRTVNRSILVLTFQACPMYVNGADEWVTFNFPFNVTGNSGIPYASVTNMSFGIKFFNGTFAIAGLQTNYSVDDIGAIRFVMTLQGGELFAPDISACVTAIVAAWTSNAPLTALDPSGWSNPSVRAGVLTAGGVTYSTTSYGGLAIATFQLVKDINYHTRAGEIVNMSSLPGTCLSSGNTIFPNQTYAIAIIPRRMTITMRFLNLTNVVGSVGAGSTLNGSTMRDGGFMIVLDAVNDTFDTSDTTLVSRINAAFVTSSVQPRGFAAYSSIFLTNSTTSLNETTVVLQVNQAINYVISSPELILIAVDASWTASKQTPFGANALNFSVVPSAGYITVDTTNGWYGATRNVTEIDVREGKLYFTFQLLGDQWIQERNPYVNIFKSADNSPSGFINLVEELVPSEKFFGFATNGPYQLMTLRLQASDHYDIFRDEIIYIVFSAATVSSRIAPIVTMQNTIRNCKAKLTLNIPGSFPFCVQAAAGRAVVSGMTNNMDEKVVRRGGAVMFVTLFGESWNKTNISKCIRSGILFGKDKTHTQYEPIALPFDGSTIQLINDETVSITLLKCTPYSLQGFTTPDALVITIPPKCLLSGIASWPATSSIPIQQTPGELNLFSQDPPLVTEQTIRTRNVTLNISIDGDGWNNEFKLFSGCPGVSQECSTWQCDGEDSLLSGSCVNDGANRSLSVTCEGTSSGYCMAYETFGDSACSNNASAHQSVVCMSCNMVLVGGLPYYYLVRCGNGSTNVTILHNCDSTCAACSASTPLDDSKLCVPAPWPQSIPSVAAGWKLLGVDSCWSYKMTTYAGLNCPAAAVDGQFTRGQGFCESMNASSGLTNIVGCPNNYPPSIYTSLLQGFSSSASPIAEPTGFAVKSQLILLNSSFTGNPIVAVGEGYLTLVLYPCPEYAIKESETVSLSIADPKLIRSGVIPNPFILYFTIVSVPTTLVAYYVPVTGQLDTNALSASIAASMSLATTDGIGISQSSKIGAIFVLQLFFNIQPTEFDSRTSLQLTDLFLSFTPTYLSSQFQFLCLRIDDGSGLCSYTAAQNTTGTATAAANANTAPTIFFAGGAILVILLVVADYVHQNFAQGKLAGGNRPVLLKRNQYDSLPNQKEAASKTNVNLGENDTQMRPHTLREFYNKRKKRSAMVDSGAFTEMEAKGTKTDDDDPFSATEDYSRNRNVIDTATIRHRRLADPLQYADAERHYRAVESNRELRGYRKSNRIADDIMDTL